MPDRKRQIKADAEPPAVQVLRSSELATEWEAEQMAALNVAHEYFDGISLAQLSTGKTTTRHDTQTALLLPQ